MLLEVQAQIVYISTVYDAAIFRHFQLHPFSNSQIERRNTILARQYIFNVRDELVFYSRERNVMLYCYYLLLLIAG